MNKVFKIVKNTHGNKVVVSELAKGVRKGSNLAAVLLSLLGASSAFAEPVSIQGTATSENAVSVAKNSYATAVDGVAAGQGSIATGKGFTREEFATKKAENQAALDAVNNKQDEVNNKNNQLDAAKAATDNLDKQIADLAKQQDAVKDKIKQRDALIPKQNEAKSAIEADNTALQDAQNKLNEISEKGKNIYLNFTDVLNSLNWKVLNGTDEGRNTVAKELKDKITSDFSELASKYTDKDYRSIVDGYINRQASYQGSYEAFAGFYTSDDGLAWNKDLFGFDDKNEAAQNLFNKSYFNSGLTSTDYISNYIFTTKSDDANSNLLDKYYRFGSGLTSIIFGSSAIDVNGNLVTSLGSIAYGLSGSYVIDPKSKDAYTQESLNTFILEKSSLVKAKEDNVLNLLSTNYKGQTYKLIKTLLNSNFTDNYNNALATNYSSLKRIMFALKGSSSDTARVEMLNYDGGLGILTKIKDLTASNANLISSGDISEFKKWLKKLNDYDSSIDWTFDKSAINLTDYRENLNKVLAYNNKIDKILDLYQSIIDERKKSDADTAKIENNTKELMTLKNEVLSGVDDMSNFIAGITPTYNTEWADYYLNYGKKESDAWIKRINNELKLYNDKDSLIVDTTKVAKEIQDKYDAAKAKLAKDQAALDELNKKLDDLKLTEQEKAVDDTKKAKEAEKAKAEADKTRLTDEIAKDKEELDKLKEKLSETALKDLGLHSQAYGSNAFASGDDSIAMGTNATVTKKDGIAIGHNASVTGNQSIVLGADSNVTGEKSIAIGVGHTVTGNHSTTIGDPNTISGDNVFVAGNNNTVKSNNVMVMGNNISVAEGNDGAVVIGADSTVAKASPTASIAIKGTTYNFAGTKPTSTVSVGSTDGERQIVNVAAGRISETSTDAINGSQLYAVTTALENFKSIDPDSLSKTTVVAGDNVKVSSTTSGKDVIYTVSANGTSVVAGKNATVASTTDENGKTTFTVNANGTTLKAGDGMKVSSSTDDNGDTTYTLTANSTVVKAGKNTTVESETAENGTTTYTVNANNSVIAAGKNVTVNSVTGQDGTTTYTIDANPATTITGGDGVVAKETIAADGSVTYTLDANQSTVSSGAGITVSTSTSKTANGATITDYKVALSDDLKAQIAKEESVSAGSSNVVVKQDGTSDTGGKNFVVDLAKSIDLTSDGSLTIGGVKLSNTEVNAGGNKVSNVANGTTASDAVNLAQLNASKVAVVAGDKAQVTSTSNENGTTYTVTALTSEVKGGDNVKVTESKGADGQSVYTTSVTGDLTGITSVSNGDTKVSLGSNTVSVNGATIGDVAEGQKNTDAVNLAQLNRSKSSVVSGGKVKVESTSTENGTTYTVTALTSEVKGGDNVKVTESKGADGQSVYTASVNGDLTGITSVSNTDGTTVSIGGNKVDVGGATINNVGTAKQGTDATNKDYVDNSHSTVTSEDGSVEIVQTVTNNTTGATKYDLSVKTAGVTTTTDDGVTTKRKSSQALVVKGDSKNVKTSTTSNGDVQVSLADNLAVNSVTTGGVSMSGNGVNAGGKKVTNVANGEVSATSTDAINGSQLYVTNRQVAANTQQIINLDQSVNNLDNRVSKVEHKVDKLNKKRKAGTASALATAGLLQSHKAGQSGVTAAVGQYQSQTAIAVGYSRLSDNGKVGVKLSVNANTEHEVGGTVGVGYFW